MTTDLAERQAAAIQAHEASYDQDSAQPPVAYLWNAESKANWRTPPTPEPYRFLFRTQHLDRAYLDELIECRELIERLPTTLRTFNPTKRLEMQTSRQLQQNPKLLLLTGSWYLPQWFTGGGYSVKSRFVNPTGADVERYSLAGAECACGRVITNIANAAPLEEVHDTGCTTADRRRVVAAVKAKRVRQLLLGAHLNLDSAVVARTIGVSRQSAMDLLRRAGLSWSRLREIGRRRMAVTVAQLRTAGYTQATIAQALGYSISRIQEYETTGVELQSRGRRRQRHRQ